MMNRLLLVSLAALAGLSALLPSSWAFPPPSASVTTVVTQPVSASGFECGVSGTMKATFTVTLNGDGTAGVEIAFRPIRIRGTCGQLSGAAIVTTTVPIGTASTVTGGNWAVTFGHFHVSATFTANADGHVANVTMTLFHGF